MYNNNINVRKNLKQLHKTIQAKNQLRNMFLSKKLMDLGLYEQAVKLQQPTTEIISKSSEDNKKGIQDVQGNLQLIKKTIENEGELLRQQKQQILSLPQTIQNTQDTDYDNLSPVEKTSYNLKYILQQKNETYSAQNGKEYPIWRIGESQINYILVKINGKECILNITTRGSKPIKVTEGLDELFFNGALDRNKITTDDINTWKQILKESGIPEQYKSSKFFKDIMGDVAGISPQPRKSVKRKTLKRDEDLETPFLDDSGTPKYHYKESEKEGEGLKKIKHKREPIIVIPSNPDQLRSELLQQLSEAKSGNNNTFNHVNGILKELLKQKEIKAKEYRDVLREFYHI
jgi:hypothetical protein